MRFDIVYYAISPHLITHRICFNPNYPGGPTGIPNTKAVKIRRAVKPETRERIKESVRREGIRNPLLVYRGSEGYFLGFGGGRLQAAIELGLHMIPCIIVDYTGEQAGTEITPDNWADFFEDPPKHFVFTDYGIDTHYGLERGRRDEIDEAGLAWASADDMQILLRESPWLEDD